ncbi:MAG: glycosyltransferase family 39 protein, partial [Candidatus Aerophobetes bacterium]|nr:glycosyltransferase family 39 protein [Candidatus Aerophobetes bacterium]
MIERGLKRIKWILLFGWVAFIYLCFLYFWRGKILWGSIGETFFRLFLLFIFLLINIGLGKKILKWLKFKIEFFLESLLFSLGVGLAIFTFLLIGLGLAGLFNRWVAHLLLLWAFLFTYKEIEDVISQIKVKFKSITLSRISSLEIVLFLILFIQIIFNLFGALVLPSGWDALSVHLVMPKEWGRLHRLIRVPYLRFGGNTPYNIGILYGMALLIKDAILAKLIHFSFGILTGIGVYALSKRYFSHRVGLLASVIFYTVPIVSWQSTTAYVDLGFTFYAFLAVYAFVNWINSKRRGWLFISAVITGLSLGSKYTGFLWMGILCLGVLINDLFFKKEKFIVLVKNFSLFTILGGLIGSFWYLRSGQSIFRLLYYILKGGMWRKAFAMTGTKAAVDLVSSS